jgi:hypothetical protein
MRSAELRDLDSEALKALRAELLHGLPSLETVLRGSLIERFLRCGKPGCHCAQGRGHGPKNYLSISHPKGRPEMLYVTGDLAVRVQGSLKVFAAVRHTLDRICAINTELLRRRERF